MKGFATRGILIVIVGCLLGADGGKQDQLWQYRNLGKAFYENPTTKEEAVQQFKAALALNPNSARERLNYGLALLRAGELDQGVAELQKVQKQSPELPHTWFNLGVVYKRRGETEQAITQFERMVQLVPGEPVSHYNLGVLYRQSGKPEEAMKQFRTAARLDRNFIAPRFQIFDILRESGDSAEMERALAEFQAVKKQQDPDSPEDVNWSYYSEIYDSVEPQTDASVAPAQIRFTPGPAIAKANPADTHLLALDVNGDGKTDVLVWSASGAYLLMNGTTRATSGLEQVTGITAVAAGDFDNDGAPDLCVLTASGAALYRNESGVFRPAAAKLPSGRFRSALWLDYDHDYDLDLLLAGAETKLLRNQGPAGWEDHTSDLPFRKGEAVATALFRALPDTKTADFLISYSDGNAVLYRDHLAGHFEAEPAQIPRGATALEVADINNDSALDVLFTSEGGTWVLLNKAGQLTAKPSRIADGALLTTADLDNSGTIDLVTTAGVFLNRGSAGWVPAPALARTAALAADFDGDGRADLLTAAAGSLRLERNATASSNGWLAVALTGVKNLKIPLGSEIEIKSGSDYQKRFYTGTPVVLGTGKRTAIDAVRITWPNGMIQNEVRKPAGEFLRVVEAPRLSGSCPMIFTWNGRQFEYITDVLGVAPLGASSGDGTFFPVDHDEYVQLPDGALTASNGRYDIRITEELAEVSYLDQVSLVAVDHPASVEIFSNDKWKSPPFPEFRLFAAAQRIHPVRARDGQGTDVLAPVSRTDSIYADTFRRDYAGFAEPHSLELDFGSAAPSNRAVLILRGWVDWADASAFLSAAQQNPSYLKPPSLQVKNERGEWVTVIEDMGMPSGKTKTVAVDLTGKFLSRSREVRILSSMCVFWDEIFLSEDSAPPPARITRVNPASADLRFRGFSRAIIHPERKQPERFDYSQVSPVSNWNPTPGMYTRYGDVRELMGRADDRYVIMGSGDELRLSYDASALPPLGEGQRRTFLLYVDGWAKDRDANTAHSQTVEPLPFHGMSAYPYPPQEHYPRTPEHERYRREYNTRPALRVIRPLTD